MEAGHPWAVFAVRRTGRLAVSLLVVVTASFAMIHLVPGDPVRAALGASAPDSVVEARRAMLGLNQPIWVQYGHYLRGLLHGDLGASLTSRLGVGQVIASRLPATLALAGLAFTVALVLAVPLGTLFAVLTSDGGRPRTELAFTSLAAVFGAVPEFLVAVGLVYVFAVGLHWLPAATRTGASSYLLPVVALALGPAAVLARVLRVELLGVLGAGYVTTARAKRLPPYRVYLRHALPNALTATLTVAGLVLSSLVAGTVLVENVFAWPGLGSEIVDSILAKDYPVVQGIVLVYGTGVLLVNLIVDITLALLDPRSAIRDA